MTFLFPRLGGKPVGRFQLVLMMIGVALLFFFVTRTVLLAMSWHDAYAGMGALLQAYGVGLIYDLAFYLYASIPVALYLLFVPERLWASRANRLAVHGMVFVTLYALAFIAAAEIIFWNEFKVRFNFIAVDYLVYSHETSSGIYESFPVVRILAGLLLLTVALYGFLRRRINTALDTAQPLRARFVAASVMLLLPIGLYAGVGQELRQIGSNTYINELAGNGPYQFIAAFRNNELSYENFYATLPAQQASELLRKAVVEHDEAFLDASLFDLRRQSGPATGEKRLNVMLIMVESLSADYLGRFGNRKGITPNLDRLVGESLFFTNFYATGTRTVRGLEAVTLSFPPTPGRSIVKRIGRESGMWSLGNVLRDKGYDVRFLYGGRGYFDNMNAFFAGNGYDIVDQTTIPENEIHFSNAWGIADEDLYTQALKQADVAHRQQQPFFFHLMTTSNHRPYTFPASRIDLPSGSSGNAGRRAAVKYTDWAIGDFLARARRQPWFDDTLFVILADHCASSAGRVALPLNRYHIPMWIYSPRHLRPREIGTVSSQIDVAPTVLAMLGMHYVSGAFGKNILTMQTSDQRALIGNHQHLGLYRPGKIWILSPQRKIAMRTAPESDNVQSLPAEDDAGLREAIAYYQGASYAYQHHLNAWSPVRNKTQVARVTAD